MPGKGTAMEFYTEPPVISQATISFMIHIKNKVTENVYSTMDSYLHCS